MAEDSLDAYLATIERMEKDITMVDAAAFHASAAISLRRIADALEQIVSLVKKEVEH